MLAVRRRPAPRVGDTRRRTSRRRTSSRATGATSGGSSPATRTSRRTCRSASRIPQLHARFEQSPADRLAEPLSRQITIFRQSTDEGEVDLVARGCRVTDCGRRGDPTRCTRTTRTRSRRRPINWFLPELDSPFYGGINTALRMADHLGRVHGVENRFVLWAAPERRLPPLGDRRGVPEPRATRRSTTTCRCEPRPGSPRATCRSRRSG